MRSFDDRHFEESLPAYHEEVRRRDWQVDRYDGRYLEISKGGLRAVLCFKYRHCASAQFFRLGSFMKTLRDLSAERLGFALDGAESCDFLIRERQSQ